VNEEGLSARQSQLIDQLFSNLPADFNDKLEAVNQIRSAIQLQLAKKFETSFNEYIGRQPQSTPSERRDLAPDLNAFLRSLGLAIKCPMTGLPAILIVDNAEANQQDKTRFRLEVKDRDGKRKRTKTYVSCLPSFELIPALPRIESFARRKKTSTQTEL